MRNYIRLVLLLSVILILGCENYDSPTILKPKIDDVEITTSIDIGFEITADAGYHSSNVNANTGSAVHLTELGQGAVQGLIYVTYTSPAVQGKDYIIFTIKDNEGKQASIKVEVNIINKQ